MADLGSLLGAAGIGGAIGQAIVRLELDTSKYQAEMKTAQASTVASTNAMGTSTSKFAGLAQTALLGVGVAAVAGAALSVKAAIEANDAHLKLQNTFANNASIADSSVEAFEAQADALRDLTGVDDEAIITSQALLAQFDLTGQQVMDLTPLIVDLSEKMDIDLQAATKAVGKATQGNAGILSRYGIILDETGLQADAFGTTLKGLGVVQGFAADRADQEPWRVLGAQFEEIAEQIGQALLPVLQSLADLLTDILPILAKVAEAIQFLPLVQMSEGFDQGGSAVDKFTNALFDSIPVLGHFVDVSGGIEEKLSDAIVLWTTNTGLIEGISAAFREQLTPAVEKAQKDIKEFANLSTKEFKDWNQDTKESFDSFVLGLEEGAKQANITEHEFTHATLVMRREARQLADAMHQISQEKWVNEQYIAFLSAQGPEWLIGFTKLTEEQQRKAQEAWQRTTDKTKEAKDSLDDITGVVDKLNNGKTRHQVIIEYSYVGFDPTKPGMSGGGGPVTPQQRP